MAVAARRRRKIDFMFAKYGRQKIQEDGLKEKV